MLGADCSEIIFASKQVTEIPAFFPRLLSCLASFLLFLFLIPSPLWPQFRYTGRADHVPKSAYLITNNFCNFAARKNDTSISCLLWKTSCADRGHAEPTTAQYCLRTANTTLIIYVTLEWLEWAPPTNKAEYIQFSSFLECGVFLSILAKNLLVLKPFALYSRGWYLQDNWIAHQDDFNQLLAELNDCHGQGETGRFMFCSIRCWKLNGVSILCRSLAEAQSFGLLIVSLLRSTTSAWPPNPVGDEGHAAIKFVCWSQGISFVLRPLLKASCWGKQPLNSEHILSKTTMVLGLSRPLMGHLFPGMCHSSTSFFIKQPEPVWRLPTQSPPVTRHLPSFC